jgi:hypothetical protein
MYMVKQARVDEILDAISEANPKMQIIDREDPQWYKAHWQLWCIWAIMKVVALIRPSFVRRWRNQYTIVTSSHIAFAKKPENLRAYNVYSILRHEYVHMRDRLKYPFWFPLSYVLCFPVIWTMRSHWELRGYMATMLVAYEEGGVITDGLLDFIALQFTTDRYFWMWPNKSKVRARLREIRQDIYDGKLQGLYFGED